VPEDLQSKFSTYEEYINDLANYTYFMMGNGPVYTVKIGRISMDSAELVKNIMRGIYRTIPHILGN
jgi:ribosome biogenesis protein UTP30